MAKVERSIGGAGTGKTRMILEELTKAKREMRLGVDEIGLCTFTRAGRAEIAQRAAEAWDVDPDVLTRRGWFKTAHAIAFRQCSVADGQLIDGADGDDWVSHVVGGEVRTKVDENGDKIISPVGDGDPGIPLALKAWELARSTLSSLEAVCDRWEACGEVTPNIDDARRVIEKYELAKARERRLDYTDMIARFAGIRFTADGPYEAEPEGEAPEGLRILAIDEAQDSSMLVDRVCRRIAATSSVERILLCGDPYQSIHSFAGGDYRYFMSWDAEESTMPRSYRCPRQVLSLGEACLRQMRHGYRDRNIQPAEHSGTVSRTGSIEEAISRIKPDQKTLILGRCRYALDAYEDALTARGIPYSWVHRSGSSGPLSGYAALWELEHGRAVRGDDWAHAVEMLVVNSGLHGPLLARGEKSAWRNGKRKHIDIIMPTPVDFELLGATPALQALISSGKWCDALEQKHVDKAKKWRKAAAKFGAELACTPNVRLSTIHGAKGLEAENVILSSITSGSVERGRRSDDELHDEECRIAYVAVTRAKQNFMFVDDGTYHRMELPL